MSHQLPQTHGSRDPFFFHCRPCSVLAAGAGHVILIILLSLLIGTASGLLLIVGGGLGMEGGFWLRTLNN